MSYTTKPTITLDQLSNVNISNPVNNNFLQYNTTNGVWDNGDLSGQDINLDEIDCRVLRVSETADIVGRLANQGVASFVNDGFIFQNGISNLGDTLYIDNVNTRVGIGISNPEEDLEVCGSIQIDSANVARLKFQQSGMTPHALSEIDGEQDGTNGGDLQFYTKVDGGSVSEKLRINNIGAISIGGSANYGISGQVLTSNGSTSSVSWTTPSGGGGISSFATFQYLSTGTAVIPYDMGKLPAGGTAVRITYDTEKINQGSNITLDTTTNNGRVGFSETGYYLITTYFVGNTTETGGARHILKCQIRKNGTDYGGTDHFIYARNEPSGENTASVSVYVYIQNTSDYVEVYASEEDGNANGYIDILGTGITITKIA
jgi:hypothetical protein